MYSINGDGDMAALSPYPLLPTIPSSQPVAKIYLEKQVKLMSDGTLEADMLDERARNLLAVSREDEIVIYR